MYYQRQTYLHSVNFSNFAKVQFNSKPICLINKNKESRHNQLFQLPT